VLYFGLLDFLLGFWLFALGGFLPLNIGKSFYFGSFGVGSFWKGKELLKGKIAEGKRIVEGKMLKRG
jgi:hypothetical protein